MFSESLLRVRKQAYFAYCVNMHVGNTDFMKSFEKVTKCLGQTLT